MAIYKRYKEEDSSARMLIGTKEPGGLNSVCVVSMSINQFPARGLRVRLNELRVNSEKQSMIGNMIRERNSSLSLSMKISYHGREQTSEVTARMNSALLRLRLSWVRSICGTSSQ
jgi:hypothetical protein